MNCRTPYHSEGGSGTLVLDQPLRVGDPMKRSFPDPRQDPATQQWTSTTPGPEREWEVVAIEPTARDGEVATIRGYMRDKPPILQAGSSSARSGDIHARWRKRASLAPVGGGEGRFGFRRRWRVAA